MKWSKLLVQLVRKGRGADLMAQMLDTHPLFVIGAGVSVAAGVEVCTQLDRAGYAVTFNAAASTRQRNSNGGNQSNADLGELLAR